MGPTPETCPCDQTSYATFRTTATWRPPGQRNRGRLVWRSFASTGVSRGMKALLFRVLSLVVAAMHPVSAGRNVSLLSGEALNICDITARRRQWAALPLWAKLRRTQCEHMFSA